MNDIRPINKGFEDFKLLPYLQSLNKPINDQLIFEIDVKKNDYIYLPPNKDNFIYEIITGAVKLGGYSDDGDSFVYEVLPHNEFFGNLKYLNGIFQEYAKALIDCKIRLYDLDFFKNLTTTEPAVTNWFISYIVKRWCSAELKLKTIKEKNIEDKVKSLQEYYNIEVTNTKGQRFLLSNLLSKKDMGDLIGVTRQTVATTLQKEKQLVF